MMGPSGHSSSYGIPAFLFSPVAAAAVQATGSVAGAAVGGKSGVRMAEIGARSQETMGRQQLEAQALEQQMGQKTFDLVKNVALIGAFTVVSIFIIKQISSE
jgi:hypothetical protein